jgi:hypothetical protein
MRHRVTTFQVLRLLLSRMTLYPILYLKTAVGRTIGIERIEKSIVFNTITVCEPRPAHQLRLANWQTAQPIAVVFHNDDDAVFQFGAACSENAEKPGRDRGRRLVPHAK